MFYDDPATKERMRQESKRWAMYRIITAAEHHAEHGSLDEAALELVRRGLLSEESEAREFVRAFRPHVLGFSEAIAEADSLEEFRRLYPDAIRRRKAEEGAG